MCGLVGIFGCYKNGFQFNELEAFEHSLVLNSFRGSDSTGVISINDKGDKVSTHKTLGHASNLLATTEWSAIRAETIQKGRFLLGHGRKATVGDINLEHAHPFLVYDVDENGETTKDITLIHNGTLERYSNPGIEKFGVDSNWMAQQIADKGGEEALKEIHGAIATMWFDGIKKKLFVFRNKERPLFYMIDKPGNIYVNSEPSVLIYNRFRHKIDIGEGKIHSFNENQLYEIDLDFMIEKDPWKKTYIPIPVHKPIGQGWSRRRGARVFNQKTGQWDPLESYEDDENDMYGTRVTYLPAYLSQKEGKETVDSMMRRILKGEIQSVEWAAGKQIITFLPSTRSVHAPATSETYKMSPIPNLVRIEMENDVSCLCTYMHAGIETTEVVSPPPDPTQEIHKATAAILRETAASKETILSKKDIKRLGEKYHLMTTPKIDKVCTWHSRYRKDDDKTDTVLKNFAFSESKNPFYFRAYGNEQDGFFYLGQTIMITMEYVTNPTDSNVQLSRHSGSLMHKDTSPHIRVDFYAARGLYRHEQSITGQIVSIRAATVDEKSEDGIDIVISMGTHHTTVGMGTEQIDALINGPKKITTIGEAMKNEDKVYHAF